MADKLKVGDRVEILSTVCNVTGHAHKVGDHGTITIAYTDGTLYVDVDGETSWYSTHHLQLLHPLQGENV